MLDKLDVYLVSKITLKIVIHCLIYFDVYDKIVNISDSWEKNWIYSEHPGKEFGKFVLSQGKFWNDEENDKGT